MIASLRGRLLVASPALGDPNFDRTVVFVIEHHQEGALGVILNRQLDIGVAYALSDWVPVAAEPRSIFSGGPVGQGSAIALADVILDDVGSVFTQIVGSLGVLDIGSVESIPPPGVHRVRVFSGYSGWDGDQLEAEIAAEAWFVVDAKVDDVFALDPDGLWEQVLSRQSGALGRVANYPPELWLN
ncbi:MAG: YqgE/AlgH family protein [Acidimicrobiales bacterium]